MTLHNAPWWLVVLRDERRWCNRLRREGEVEARDEKFIRQWASLSLLVSSMMVLLVPRPALRSVCRYFFVSFGQDELMHSAVRSSPDLFAPLNFGPRAIFSSIRLGFVLNSIYWLITVPGRTPARLRKFLLVRHFAYLEKLMPQLQRYVFLVKQDYFGPSSLLVSLSRRVRLNVLGVQHGLMNTDSILEKRIYPCIRTQVEYAYDEFYRSVFTEVKPASTTVEVLGPPYDCGTNCPAMGSVLRVVFISSGHLRNEAGRGWIAQVCKVAEVDGLAFALRPHPSEEAVEDLGDYTLLQSSLATVFDGAPGETLFVGIFSSLLYQAAFKGFRTLWLQDGIDVSPLHAFLLRELPNAKALRREQLEAGVFKSFREHPPHPVARDSVSARLTMLLEASFPRVPH